MSGGHSCDVTCVGKEHWCRNCREHHGAAHCRYFHEKIKEVSRKGKPRIRYGHCMFYGLDPSTGEPFSCPCPGFEGHPVVVEVDASA